MPGEYSAGSPPGTPATDNAVVPARVYVPDLPSEGHTAALSADEAHHVTRVLRLATGAVLRAFDGHGREHEVRIELAGKGGVIVRVGPAMAAAEEPPIAVTLVQAVLKSDQTDAVVRDSTMLGLSAFVPVVTARTETTLARIRQQHRRERWERIAIASAKQCGRAVLPTMADPVGLDSVLASNLSPVFILVEPRAAGAPCRLRDAMTGLSAPPAATLVVGPEGGWTEAELFAAAAAGWTGVTLGARTLRADAAAVVALSVLLSRWGDL